MGTRHNELLLLCKLKTEERETFALQTVLSMLKSHQLTDHGGMGTTIATEQ